jgi:hypothetical protein
MGYKYNSVRSTIESDRVSGFKNSSYAVAEVLDNSIQAGFRTKKNNCEIQLIIVEEKISIGLNNFDRISKIIVADNGDGMDVETLSKALAKGEGINKNEKGHGKLGKYGFGLYMSSISQCRRTDIYTWRNNKFLRSWLDIDEILDPKNGREEVPVEEIKGLPEDVIKVVPKINADHGTIVVWSNLDLATWKTGAGLFKNVEYEIGRIYRYFINEEKIKIHYKLYKKISEKNYSLEDENFVRANDPLFLMSNTICPEPWSKKPGFATCPDEIIDLKINGKQHQVKIKFAIAKEDFRGIEEHHGSKPWGQLARKNNGVSILRSGRELELNSSWNNPSEPRERWANAEIHFEGNNDLDKLFQVTNNKQYAMALHKRDITEKADNTNKTEPGYLSLLEESDYPEYICTKISQKITSRLNALYSSIREWRKDKGSSRNGIAGSAEDTTTKAREARKKKTKADEALEAADKNTKLKVMIERLISGGMPKIDAEKLAIMSIERNISTVITTEEINSPIFFDVKIIEGQYHIIINKSHPAYLDFFNLIEKESSDKSMNEPSSDRAIKLMLSSWASLEDEAISDEKEYSSYLQDIKIRWGQIFRDFLNIKEK